VARFSLDSNILFYAADPGDRVRHLSALDILTRAAAFDCVLIPQAFAEFFSATTRKGVMPRAQAAAQIRDWVDLFPVAPGPTGAQVLDAAAASVAGAFQFYDALLLATAGAAGCTALISEHMANSAQFAGVQVVAAFDATGGITATALALLEGSTPPRTEGRARKNQP
jgi:predicted nucleic acid-binding protein